MNRNALVNSLDRIPPTHERAQMVVRLPNGLRARLNEPLVFDDTLAGPIIILGSSGELVEPRDILTTHQVNEVNEGIEILVSDDRGPGGANHHYVVLIGAQDGPEVRRTDIMFQKGPVKEAGINGLTQEVLLAIVQHRLEGFQSGQFACEENGIALGFVKAAMETLKRRTARRVTAGIEGTMAPDPEPSQPVAVAVDPTTPPPPVAPEAPPPATEEQPAQTEAPAAVTEQPPADSAPVMAETPVQADAPAEQAAPASQ